MCPVTTSLVRLVLLPQLAVQLSQCHHRIDVARVVGAQLLHNCLVDLQAGGRA